MNMPVELPQPKRFVADPIWQTERNKFHLYGDQAVMDFVRRLDPVVTIYSSADGSRQRTVIMDMRYCSTRPDAVRTQEWILDQLNAQFSGQSIPTKLR